MYIIKDSVGWAPRAAILQRVAEGIETRVEH